MKAAAAAVFWPRCRSRSGLPGCAEDRVGGDECTRQADPRSQGAESLYCPRCRRAPGPLSKKAEEKGGGRQAPRAVATASRSPVFGVSRPETRQYDGTSSFTEPDHQDPAIRSVTPSYLVRIPNMRCCNCLVQVYGQQESPRLTKTI